MKQLKLTLILSGLLLFISSCEKDEPKDPVIPNEEEVITTLTYTLTPSAGGTPIVFSFQDLDGDFGNQPTVSEDTLSSQTTYTGSIQLLNELESPAEDITLEVSAEANEHQFFFQSSTSDLSVSYNDADGNSNPVGIITTLTTTTTGASTLTITLKHKPNKGALGVKDGDITNAGGETDIEVTFNVVVQ